MSTQVKKSKFAVVAYAVLALVFVAMLAGALYVALVNPLLHVKTGSMEPTLPVNSRVLVLPVDGALEPGTIIKFQEEGNAIPTVHTFVGYEDDGSLMTKGDANPTPDAHVIPLTRDDVLGKVVWISNTPTVIAYSLILIGLFVLLWVYMPDKSKNNQKEVQSEQVRDESRETSPA